MSVEILNKDEAVYKIGESVTFRVSILARKEGQDLNLRMELHFADSVPVGTVPAIRLGAMCEGEFKSFIIKMDTTILTAGKYKVGMVTYEKGMTGLSVDYDNVVDAFGFEIEEETEWNRTAWGHINLNSFAERL